MISLETVLCDPRFFGLDTAMPVQRAIARTADGLPLGDLAGDRAVLAALGGDAAVASLPVGERPARVDFYSGIRTAKSLIAAAAAVRASQSVDVSHLRPGELARVPVISLDTDKARIVIGHLVGTITSKPALRALLVGEPTADTITLKHPSGRPVEITVAAGRRAGGSLVGRWLAGAIFDEAPRMLGADDGVINLDDALAAVEGRILPGGQIFVIGSPYAPWGPCFDSVRDHWGKPSRHRVVFKAPAPALNPAWWTSERCADLRERNPRAFKTDVLGEFADASSAAFEGEWIDRAIRAPGPHIPLSAPIGILDSSAGRGDSFSWAIAQWCIEPSVERYEGDDIVENGVSCRVVRLNQVGLPTREQTARPPFLRIFGWGAITGQFRDSLSFDDLVAHIASEWAAAGVYRGVGDGYQSYPMTAAFHRHGIVFQAMSWTQESKSNALARARHWFRDSAIVLDAGPESAALRRELVQLQVRPTPSGGESIGARHGGHDDRAAIVLNAAMLDDSGEFRGSPIQNRGGRIFSS